MINMDDLQFQKLDFEGLKQLVAWAEKEGWNPGPNDAEIYWQTDPNGFYGYHHNGELIGGGSLVSYDGKFGFMGFFIVKPEYRAAGIGRKLWFERRNHLLERLEKGAAIGMDGVLAMQDFYKKGGFEIAFKDERHERLGSSFELHSAISAINSNDWEALLDYDKRCFTYSRPQFLKPWLNQKGAVSYKYLEDTILKGFIIARPAYEGY